MGNCSISQLFLGIARDNHYLKFQLLFFMFIVYRSVRSLKGNGWLMVPARYWRKIIFLVCAMTHNLLVRAPYDRNH